MTTDEARDGAATLRRAFAILCWRELGTLAQTLDTWADAADQYEASLEALEDDEGWGCRYCFRWFPGVLEPELEPICGRCAVDRDEARRDQAAEHARELREGR